MKNRVFLSEIFLFLVLKFSVYLNWHVFVMGGNNVAVSFSFLALLFL